MENKITISEELRSLSPLLAEKRPGHPYSVPSGYFELFPSGLMEKVSEPAVRVSQVMPMGVPEGYFDGLAASILDKIKQSAQEEVAEPESSILAGIGKQMPYQVPVGYFEGLERSVQSVFWNEGAPTVLTVINRKNPFTVPEGYFAQFPSTVLKLVPRTRKIAPVYPIDFVRKVYRYAAAAVLVGIVSVAALMFFRSDRSASGVANNTTIDINNVTIDELQNYITGQESIEPENLMIATNEEFDAADLREFLDDMPDAALQTYIQEYAQPNTN